MMPKSLYELTQEEMQLLAELEGILEPEPDPDTGEIPDTAARLAALIAHQATTAQKIDAVIHVVDILTHRADLARADYESKRAIIERSRDAAKRAESHADRLRYSIVHYMRQTGASELLSASGLILKLRRSPHSVDVPPDAPISTWDEEFFRVKWEAEKKAILAAWKAGREIPTGVEIKQGYSLTIK